MDIVELLLLKISVTSSRQLSNALQMRKEVSKGPGRLKNTERFRMVPDGYMYGYVIRTQRSNKQESPTLSKAGLMKRTKR